MRWLVLIVVVVIGLLFWYDPGGLVPKWGTEMTTVPAPVVSLSDLLATPVPPPTERIKGSWVRMLGSETLDFHNDGKMFRGFPGGVGHYEFLDNDRIQIRWNQNANTPITEVYTYEFKDNILILTDDAGGRFMYWSRPGWVDFEGSYLGLNIGPNLVAISGRLVGPVGVLAEQSITLERFTLCADRQQPSTCKKEIVAKILTDSMGQYKFLNIEPGYDYGLTFEFSVADPYQIPEDAPVGNFVLTKRDSEITARSNSFYLNGFESEQMKVIDFIYPSAPPPTVTPSPVTATPTLDVSIFSIPTLVPTSTPTVQPTPPISLQVRPRSQETTVGTPLLASMILEYYGENYTPEYLRELFIQKGKDAGRYPGNEAFYEQGGVFNQDMLDGVMSLGYNWKEECQSISGDEEFNQRRQQLVDSLTAGRPALIGLWSESSGYNVIVVGYDPATQMYTYLDPKQVSVGEDQLKQLWRQEVIDRSISIETADRCIISTSPKS